MKKSTPEESRRGFERIMTPFHIGVFATMWFVSGGLAITGFFLGINTEAWKTAKPDPNLFLLLFGLAGFVFAFPVMVCLGVSRLVLSRIRELGRKINDVA
jgi:hypothetical protein